MLKAKITNNNLTIGSWITLYNESLVEIFAKSGFDWLVVDLEHSAISIDQAAKLIRVIDLSGCSPLVRLTSNDPNLIKRVMDAGAHGIIVPNINSSEEAKKAVMATRYAPLGTRGVGLARAQGYGATFDEYYNWQKKEPVVIVQIESKESLEYLEDIFSVNGVDGFIIGPYDLSSSMGIPGNFSHPEFINAVDLILNAGKKCNCASGTHIIEPDHNLLKETIEQNYKIIAYSVDIRIFDSHARNSVNLFKELIK